METKDFDLPRFVAQLVTKLAGLLLLGAAGLLSPAGRHGPAPGLEAAFTTRVLWGASAVLTLAGFLLILRRRPVSMLNLGLTVGVCAGCLGLFEIALAVKGVQPLKRIVWHAPALVPWWQLDPAQGGRFLPEKYDGAWRINAQGFPDSDDFDVEKASAVPRRILLLGDSFAYGASASRPAKSFAELLDEKLDVDVQTVVWNTAIPGTGQESQFHLLSSFLPILRPQIVIATLCRNDFGDNQFPPDQHYVFSDGNWVQRYSRVSDTSFVALSPLDAYRRAFAPQSPREYLKVLRTASAVANLLHRWEPTNTDLVALPAPKSTPGYAETQKWLGRIRDSAKEAGARLMVLIIPDRTDLAGPTPAYRDMQTLCKELGVDTVEVLRELGPGDYAPMPDTHWNDGGHAKAATRLDAAVRNAWPPPPH